MAKQKTSFIVNELLKAVSNVITRLLSNFSIVFMSRDHGQMNGLSLLLSYYHQIA